MSDEIKVGAVFRLDNGFVKVLGEDGACVLVTWCSRNGTPAKSGRTFRVKHSIAIEAIGDDEIDKAGLTPKGTGPVQRYAQTDKPQSFHARLMQEETGWD
jgi:hypothetical protein